MKSNSLLFQCIFRYLSNLVRYKPWTEMNVLLLHMITLHIHLGRLYYSKQKQVWNSANDVKNRLRDTEQEMIYPSPLFMFLLFDTENYDIWRMTSKSNINFKLKIEGLNANKIINWPSVSISLIISNTSWLSHLIFILILLYKFVIAINTLQEIINLDTIHAVHARTG